ncbi:riboflavin synthase [Flavobacteriaceae bacterium LSUCC0859]|jgi:riboflavin synthase|nr:riboflavin synthase [Flavobacteriaceae bacterium LSUCC0859]
MFTGIIETLGKVVGIERQQGNMDICIECALAKDLKIDQSVAHNGVCLTVVSKTDKQYTVTAIAETLEKTAIGSLQIGEFVNLERAMIMGSRLDGHIVQGHVDQTGICTQIKETDGSWLFSFSYEKGPQNVTIEKGSITIDGTSLTVVDSKANSFSVAIIPYTYEHTRFKQYKIGTLVNLEFDVIGKYVKRLLEVRTD